MQKVAHNLLLFLFLSTSPWSLAQSTDTTEGPIVSPQRIAGTRIVNSEQLIQAASEDPGLVLIDSRVTADRTDGFIEGSVNLTDTDTSCASLAEVVPAKTTAVLFYCNGIRCGRSARAAEVAVGCGYSDVLWFRAGMEEWLNKEYPLVH